MTTSARARETASAALPEPTSIELNDVARDVARAEAQAVLAASRDPERRGRLAELIADVDESTLTIDSDTADALEEILELGLQTGRVRARYGPEGERAALATFRKLPRGRELTESARELTDALQALTGQRLD